VARLIREFLLSDESAQRNGRKIATREDSPQLSLPASALR
jgi:hypothetical protein